MEVFIMESVTEDSILELIKQHENAVKEIDTYQTQFFDKAAKKMKPFSDILSKYKIRFLQVPIKVNTNYGNFSSQGKINLVVTEKGVGILDFSKDVNDKHRFVELSFNTYKKLPNDVERNNLTELTRFIANNISNIQEEEVKGIYSFYKEKLDSTQSTSTEWFMLNQSI
jgi:hypothetical protein